MALSTSYRTRARNSSGASLIPKKARKVGCNYTPPPFFIVVVVVIILSLTYSLSLSLIASMHSKNIRHFRAAFECPK
jgi:hypothetical protein